VDRTNNVEFDWSTSVEAVTDQHLAELAAWRSYSSEICRWSKERGIIGSYKGNVAFPVHDESGRVSSVQHVFLDKGKRKLRFLPGTKVTPLIIGRLEGAHSTFIFESIWDAIAFLDRSEAYLDEGTAVIVTHSAKIGRLDATKTTA